MRETQNVMAQAFTLVCTLTKIPFLAPNPCAASKAVADLALGGLAAEAGLRMVRFRPFNHIGPAQPDAFVIPAFAAQIARIKAGTQQPVILSAISSRSVTFSTCAIRNC